MKQVLEGFVTEVGGRGDGPTSKALIQAGFGLVKVRVDVPGTDLKANCNALAGLDFMRSALGRRVRVTVEFSEDEG